MITIREVAADDADAHALWLEQQADLALRYDEPDLVLETEFPTLVASLVGDVDGSPVASLVLRWSPYHEPGVIELKRLFVRPGHRGHGHSRVMMGVAESLARRSGATRLVLETGDQQPEALSLYDRIGYRRIPNFGEYKHEEGSICYGLDLPTRVLVVNGTMGAGKSAVAAGVLDALEERGARASFIDADALCQAVPTAADDPYHQDLLFASLERLAPLHRARGYGCVVLARVVEDADDRARYVRAFGCDAGAAEVVLARVTAPEDVRLARLDVREPPGRWRDFAHARTAELDDVLESLALDDVVIENAGRSARETAEELLAEIGW